MSELKLCQMSHKQAAEKLQESYDYMTCVMPEGKRSTATKGLLEAMSLAIAALRRAQPTNKPLTLEQLRNMGNMAVWVESDDADDPRCGAYIVDDRPEFCNKPLVNCHYAISADEIKSGKYRIYCHPETIVRL